MRTPFFLLLILFASCGCKKGKQLTPGEGFIEVNGGKIWYSVSGEGKGTPILALHGGPGFPSFYLNPLKALGDEYPVILFDQLGCGRSDQITDTTLMTREMKVEEVRRVVEALNLKEFYLYGQSWGTMLGLSYYLKYPQGVKALIMGSPYFSSKIWVTDADTLIAALPEPSKSILQNDKKGIPQDSAARADAIGVYYANYYYRKQPISADLDSAFAQWGFATYLHMWGPTEFAVTGNLKEVDLTGQLSKIKVPTLYIAGEYDAARPATVLGFQQKTPNAKRIIIPNSGHITSNDQPKADLKAIRDFLKSLE